MAALWSVEAILIFFLYHDLESVVGNNIIINNDTKENEDLSSTGPLRTDEALNTNAKQNTLWYVIKNGK